MIVRRLFNCCETVLNDFYKIVERFFKDFYTILKSLLNDG